MDLFRGCSAARNIARSHLSKCDVFAMEMAFEEACGSVPDRGIGLMIRWLVEMRILEARIAGTRRASHLRQIALQELNDATELMRAAGYKLTPVDGQRQ